MKIRHRKSVHWFKTWLLLYYFIANESLGKLGNKIQMLEEQPSFEIQILEKSYIYTHIYVYIYVFIYT